jgi:hypothetical protein
MFPLSDQGMERISVMEELSRLHKDVPFGWALWVSQWLAARRRRKALAAPHQTCAAPQIRRDDWPRLSAPR